MNNKLVTNNLIPTTSPYSDALELPVSSSFSQDIVDWVWIELRDAANQTNIALSRSALLKRNGDVVDTDGHKPIICDIPDGDYYLMVSHRNHLGVITANPINISCGTTVVDLKYDSSLLFGGINSLKELDYGDIGLYAGDYNGDGQIQNTDKNAVEPLRGLSGYNNADINMNGEVQNSDLNIFLSPNLGKGEQVMSNKLHAKRKKD